MHYIKSKSRANAFRLASSVFTCAYLSLFVTAGATIYVVTKNSENHLLFYGIVLGSTLLLWTLAIIISGTCRCQLCQASTMRSLKCSHHSKAKRLLRSYRLRIAIDILLKGHFRCSYCGEVFSLKSEGEEIQNLTSPDQRRFNSRRTGSIPSKRRH